MKINFIDLQRQYQEYKNEIDAQMQDVLKNSSFIMGPKIEELEQKLAKFVGTRYAIGCASGTDALLLALMAFDIKPGDEIITTPFTFIATAEVITFLKAKPVFVDIREDTFNIDSKMIEKAITKQTRGIIPVDLFGQCADYDEINAIAKKRNLFVIEDACQSFGAEYKKTKAGSFGDIGCTSFFPAKPLGCYGDGGAIFLNDERKAEIIRSFRVHGQGKDKYDNVRIGINGRLDTLQAAILLAKLNHFGDELKARQNVADYYTQQLKEVVQTPEILAHNFSVYAQYCIRVENRETLQKALKDQGIPTVIYYPKPLHLQGAFANLGYKKEDFPISEKVSEDILALPMHPFLTRVEQDFIIERIKSFYAPHG